MTTTDDREARIRAAAVKIENALDECLMSGARDLLKIVSDILRDLFTEAEERGRRDGELTIQASITDRLNTHARELSHPDLDRWDDLRSIQEHMDSVLAEERMAGFNNGLAEGEWVECPECEAALGHDDPAAGGVVPCGTCGATDKRGRIRRELKGALWGVKIASPTPEAYHRHRDECIEKWGE